MRSIAAVLASAIFFSGAARAADPPDCIPGVDVIDEDTAVRACLIGDGNGVGYAAKSWHDFLAHIDLIPAFPRYNRWSLGPRRCFFDATSCPRDGKLIKCNGSPLCPIAEFQYPLGGIDVRKKLQVMNDECAKLTDGNELGWNVRRAFSRTLDEYRAKVRLVRFGVGRMIAPFWIVNRFDCTPLHQLEADLLERTGWARVLQRVLEPLAKQAFEGIDLVATSDVRVRLLRGAAVDAIRLRIGDLFDSINAPLPVEVERYRGKLSGHGALPEEVTGLGDWRGGRLPIRVTPDGQAWSAGQWSSSPEPEHLDKPWAGYRAWPIRSQFAPDWKVHVLARDTQPPTCGGFAVWADARHLSVDVEMQDDWAPGHVDATLMWGQYAGEGGAALQFAPNAAARADGDHARLSLISTMPVAVPSTTNVDIRCVDAAGNATRATVVAVACPPHEAPQGNICVRADGEGEIGARDVTISVVDFNSEQDDYYDVYVNGRMIGRAYNPPGGTTRLPTALHPGANLVELRMVRAMGHDTGLQIQVDPGNYRQDFHGTRNHSFILTSVDASMAAASAVGAEAGGQCDGPHNVRCGDGHCCTSPSGSMCCGKGCCPSDATCCGGGNHCCVRGTICCEGGCCSDGERCVGGRCVKPAAPTTGGQCGGDPNSVPCVDGHCCMSSTGMTCCGSGCCPAGYSCINGNRCQK